MVVFCLTVGIIGFLNLIYFGHYSVKTIHNVTILNEIYDNISIINSGVYNMLYVSDMALSRYVVQTTKKHSEELTESLNRYLEIQGQFSDVFTPGEIQDMANILELHKETYLPVLYEVFNLVEQGKRDQALTVSMHRLDPIYNSFIYHLNIAFNKNLEYSEARTIKNSEYALVKAYLILVVVLISLIVSVVLSFATTKSISAPLLELETAVIKVSSGDFDVHFSNKESNDEIAQTTLKFQEMFYELNHVQQFKLETIEAKYEKEKAEASTRYKSEFLAKMSHEIRTPMNAIIGMAELALREKLPAAAHEHILTIKQAGSNLLSIINDILDFSKIESGKLEIVQGNYMFSSLVNDVISIIRMRIIDSNVQFVVNIDCNIPNRLFGDEIRFRQILLNILNNAVKYTEKGFVSFTVFGEIISEDSINLTAEIADSGKGIKQEHIGKLFGDFVQVDISNNKGIEGTGLGLAITQNLVKAMGGDISVYSEYGKGSTFTVKLPQKFHRHEKLAFVENADQKSVLIYERRHIYADSVVCTIDNLGVRCVLVSDDSAFYEKMAAHKWSFVFVEFALLEKVKKICGKIGSDANIVLLTGFGEEVSDKNMSVISMPVYSASVANILNGVSVSFNYNTNKETTARFTAPDAKVLVVDDINTNLKVVSGLLAPYKIKIDLCSGGMEAIEAVRSNHYDLVFMDHMMPEMDGIEALARIRATDGEKFKELPVIALTANAVSGIKEMFMEKGFNDFLSKPIDIVKLNTIMEKWVPKEKQSRLVKDNNKTSVTKESDTGKPVTVGSDDVKKEGATTGGKVENYLQSLALFHKDGIETINRIKLCLENDDLPLYINYMQTLKNSCAGIGADSLSETAKALETAGNKKNMAFINSHTDKLLADMELFLEGVNGIIMDNSINPEGNGANMASLNPLLAKLKVALVDMNSVAIDEAVNSLQEFALAEEAGGFIENILQNVLIGEYDEAITLISKTI
jgi:signal transduction histidine kinase/CheY-like chemotaxis protein